MAGFLTDAEKASLQADFRSAIDTHTRALTVWQEAAHTVVVSDPDFNPYTAYNQNVANVTNTPVSSVISGRIMWDRQQEWAFLKPGGVHPSEIKVKDATNRACRLKVDASGYALLATAKKVEIDGVMLDRESEPRPHGLFTPDSYTFYFVRSS